MHLVQNYPATKGEIMEFFTQIAKSISKGIAATLIIIALYLTLTIQNNPPAQQTASSIATIQEDSEKTYNLTCKKGTPIVSERNESTIIVKCIFI